MGVLKILALFTGLGATTYFMYHLAIMTRGEIQKSLEKEFEAIGEMIEPESPELVIV